MTRAEQKVEDLKKVVESNNTALQEVIAGQNTQIDMITKRLNTLEKAITQLGAVVKEMKAAE